MTATTTPEPGTAVTTKEKDGVLGDLPPALRAAYQIRKQERAVSAQVAAETWGKKLDRETRFAIAAYCQKHRIDVTEIDVLGGSIYRNARFYFARLAELQQAGKIEYAYADHVGVDPRLQALAASGDDEIIKQAEAEIARRAFARIKHAIPETAQVAVVFRVKLRGTEEVTGAKWIAANPENDPVGKTKPVETCESRAARRCMRQLVANLPPAEMERQVRMDADFEVLETTVAPKLAAASAPDPNAAPAVVANGVTVRAAGGGTPLAAVDDEGYTA